VNLRLGHLTPLQRAELAMPQLQIEGELARQRQLSKLKRVKDKLS